MVQHDTIKRVRPMTFRPIHGRKLPIIHIRGIKFILFQSSIKYSACTALQRSPPVKVHYLSGEVTMSLFIIARDGVDSINCIHHVIITEQSSMVIRCTSLEDLEHSKQKACKCCRYY